MSLNPGTARYVLFVPFLVFEVLIFVALVRWARVRTLVARGGAWRVVPGVCAVLTLLLVLSGMRWANGMSPGRSPRRFDGLLVLMFVVTQATVLSVMFSEAMRRRTSSASTNGTGRGDGRAK